jgi:16S rRNA (cytosine967-C5)-methyltransferase
MTAFSAAPACSTEGKVVIQDVNSAETVKYLDVRPGMHVLDLCAAPGTKSQEIAMFMQNKGRDHCL